MNYDFIFSDMAAMLGKELRIRSTAKVMLRDASILISPQDATAALVAAIQGGYPLYGELRTWIVNASLWKHEAVLGRREDLAGLFLVAPEKHVTSGPQDLTNVIARCLRCS